MRTAELGPLQEWFNAKNHQMQESDLYYKDAWVDQILFVRDRFHRMLVNDYDARKANPVQVVSTHLSKSCQLPVYHIKGDHGIELWMRGNFYDWKISVRSEIPVPDCFFHLFERKGTHLTSNSVYFEGFSNNWVFGPYADNPQEFSLELPYSFDFAFTFAFLLGESVRAEVELAKGSGAQKIKKFSGPEIDLPNPLL